MPQPLKDISGQRFNRLLVVARSNPPNAPNGDSLWVCVCDCGKQYIGRGASVRKGHVKSCGCLNIEQSTTHGQWKSPVYICWRNMMRRCYNPKDDAYKNYGGRGISVCERWHDVRNFVTDMEPSFQKGLTIDRTDTNGNYSQENCRWVTAAENNSNRRDTVLITVGGITKSMHAWALENGLDGSTVHKRIKKYGWTPEQACTTPKTHRHTRRKQVAGMSA